MTEVAAGAAAIVARISQSEAARELAAEFERGNEAFTHLSPGSRADLENGLRRTLRRWSRFVATGAMPAESEFGALREWTRARAAEGMRLEDLLHSFGLAHQLGWQLLRRHGRPEESETLLELAGPLARYADRVSAIVTQTYLAERELLVSEEERRMRLLFDRLCSSAPLDAADSELAERLGFPLEHAYTPFAVTLLGASQGELAALAARLGRERLAIAVTQSGYLVGMSMRPLVLTDLAERSAAVLATGDPTPREGLADAREEVLLLLEHARRTGLDGRLQTDEYLLEILLQGAPRVLARLRARILDPLSVSEQQDLIHTLRTWLGCHLDRTLASSELHIHRNTLSYRLKRIEEISRLDLSSPRDLACAYIALADPSAGLEALG